MNSGIRITQDEFLKRVKDSGVKHIPIESYKGANVKIKWQCCKNKKHIFEATPNNVIRNHSGCPYCYGKKAFIGETDLWTTHPHIAKMLKNSEDGYLYSYGSNKKEDWICPDCGALISQRTIKQVSMRGLRCPHCVNNISYPEKMITSFLNQLDVIYVHDKSTDWSEHKRYDFYIPELSLIIEAHGEQHYKKVRWGTKYIEDQHKNDEYKKDLAIKNGISYYVELDCSNSTFEYIKKSILSSYLIELFDLSSFDWNLCESNIYNIKHSYYDDILNLMEQDVKPSDIAKELEIGLTTVRRYIDMLVSAGLIEYDSNKYMNEYIQRVSKRVICVETGEIFPSICSAARSVNGSDSAISKCCRGIWKKYKGYHWEFYYG